MTVQVMSEAAAVREAPLPAKPERTADRPFVYTPAENVYERPVRQFPAARRRAGFGAVPAAQLLISAGLGAALWAAVNFGDEGTRELCERLIGLFR